MTVSCAAALLAWLVGIAFPFYGTLNSVIGAFSGPVVAFAMPCLTFNLVYRYSLHCSLLLSCHNTRLEPSLSLALSTHEYSDAQCVEQW